MQCNASIDHRINVLITMMFNTKVCIVNFYVKIHYLRRKRKQGFSPFSEKQDFPVFAICVKTAKMR